jgi:putative heme-binding domain-containing protein
MDGLLAGEGATEDGYASLLQRFSAMTGASLEQDRMLDLIRKGTSPSNAKEKPWQAPLLKGLGQGIQSKKVPAGTFISFESLLVPAVFEHPEITVRQAALELLGGIGFSGNLKNTERARKLAENPVLTESERVLGINFLALNQPENQEAIFQQLIRPTEPLPVQLAAVKGLGKIQGPSPALYFLNQWPTLTPDLREAALQTLMGSEERIDLLLQALEKGQVQVSNLGWRRSVSLMNHAKESLRTRARKVINKDAGKGEKIVEGYQAALRIKGDQVLGKTVYEMNCASCHKMGEGLGLAFGPDLASLKNRSASSVMNDILIPGLSIADGYDLWAVELKNGESLQGIIGSETPSTLQLRIAGGQERSISRQDIQRLIVLENSAMPNGLDQSISHQEMADLLSFILKIK